MIKTKLEKNVIFNDIVEFKYNILYASYTTLIKLLPFICAWGSIIMYSNIEAVLLDKFSTKIENLPNTDLFMRMSLISDNYEIVSHLYDKKFMKDNDMLRYYVLSGGIDNNIYNLIDKKENWTYLSSDDILKSIRNGSIVSINKLVKNIDIPLHNYNFLTYDKHKILLHDKKLLQYYIDNNINDDLVLDFIYNKKKNYMDFFSKIVILKIFFIRIRKEINILNKNGLEFS